MPDVRDSRELGGAWAAFQRFGFAAPAPDLAPVVARYWWARWDLRGQPPYRQLIVPQPSVQLTFADDGPPLVRGVPRGRVVFVLEGTGARFGVVFRPGVFRRFLDRPVADLTDRALPASEVFDPPWFVPDPAVDGAGVDVAAVEDFLRGVRSAADPVGDQVAGWVDDIRTSSGLRRVDLAAAHCGVHPRRLQRLFAEHVGVSPKWLIRRYRLHEVTEHLTGRGPDVDWAGLAADLGYVDQAHLTRDFTAMFGEPPTSYAARYEAQE
ncbi:helix-turn-helix domain-containing protein [Dactylosporangium sp. AC04546]|uniref:helix-turn-helix domain-containing protein n=1 Tax=Dactylosporangium sp. AC04546 TaxID=2862460 RepID=UPI001EDE657C|nr:helix-turn-helix domain-containing protein [Dactylosporangium sp. AC04546]WVK86045.1 helix-turn-helix domain-containing protein [Dactylosporangium sp. AC04546]